MKTAVKSLPAETGPCIDRLPDFFTGTRFEVDEIVLGMNVLNVKTRDLKGSSTHRQAVSLKLAADDIAKVAGQIQILAAHLATKCAQHVNRKARS